MINMTPHWSANALVALQGQGTPVKATHDGNGAADDGGGNGNGNGSASANGGAEMSTSGVEGMGLDASGVGAAFDFGAHPQHWPLMRQYTQG